MMHTQHAWKFELDLLMNCDNKLFRNKELYKWSDLTYVPYLVCVYISTVGSQLPVAAEYTQATVNDSPPPAEKYSDTNVVVNRSEWQYAKV